MKKTKVKDTKKIKRSRNGSIKNAQDAIPFTEWYENKLFRINENTYSLICSFENTGYLSKPESEKERKYRAYRAALCELPSDVHYEEIVYNRPADADIYLSAVASAESCKSKYDEAFFKVQKMFVSGVDKDHSIQKYLLALSVKVENGESPYNKLHDAFVGLSARFYEMRSSVKALSSEEVFAELYRVYNPFSGTMPPIPTDIYRKGLTVRDIIAPDGIIYDSDCVRLGSHYARILSVTSLGNVVSDNLVYSLCNNNLPVYISKHIDHVDKSNAIKQIKNQLDELIARKGAREDKKRYIPAELTRSIEGCNELLNALSDGEEFLRQTIYVTLFAKTKDRLDTDTERIKAAALSQGAMLRTVTILVEDALKSILPLGCDYLTRHQFLLAGEASVITPFNYESYFDENGFYYGANYFSGEPVIRNRKLDKSSHGFVFGNTGSGKGIWVKNEISNVLFQPFCENDDIIIVDATGEYLPLADACGGKIIELNANGATHINPLHISKSRIKAVGLDAARQSKISSLIALLSELKGSNGLDAAEISLIDEIAIKLISENSSATLETFCAELEKKDIQKASEILTWLNRYTKGSVTLFAGEDTTEEDKRSKLTVYDLHRLSSDLRDAAMLAMLDRIEEKVMQNSTVGRWTWVYIDEMHRYFDSDRNPFAAERFARLYSESRKFGCILTGITQLPRPVIASRDGSTMLSNSRWVVLSELDDSNIAAVAEKYELNEEQQRNLRSPDVGQYVIRTHNAPMAVRLLYPGAKDNEKNEMYDLFNTSFKGN